MKSTKRIISTVVAAVMLAGSVSVTSFAADTKAAEPAAVKVSAVSAVRVDKDAVIKLLGTLKYEDGKFSFTIPENTSGSDWNIQIFQETKKGGVTLKTQFLKSESDKKSWKAGEYYSFNADVAGSVITLTVTDSDKAVTSINLGDFVKENQLIDSLTYKDGKVSFTVPSGYDSKEVSVHIAGQDKNGSIHFLAEGEGNPSYYVSGKTYTFDIKTENFISGNRVLFDFSLGNGPALQLDVLKIIKGYQLVNSIKYSGGKVSFTVPAGVDSKDLFIHIDGSSSDGVVNYLAKESENYSFEAGKTYSFAVSATAYSSKNSGILFQTALLKGGKLITVDIAKIINAK
ncbi:hypothetical protein FACS1894120_0220 [Clostridia bacterium]|nr:hypothetical protein FACS1894120_0220 [Clostridia bacterium]